jgi:RNA polymerase sigma-70 factor, ECF subfamily
MPVLEHSGLRKVLPRAQIALRISGFPQPIQAAAGRPTVEEQLALETPYLRAFLRKLVVGSADLEVDDLQQETMNRALKYRSSYNPQQPLRPWLQGIAFRVFLDARGRLHRGVEVHLSSANSELMAEVKALHPSSRPDVRPLLQALTEPERSIMQLTYLSGKSIPEVATELDLARGTVKSHLHRARLRLAKRFQPEDWL